MTVIHEEAHIKERPYGKSRSKHIILSYKLKNVFDFSPSCGWHECNDKYCVSRMERSDLLDSYLMILTVSGQGEARIGDQVCKLTADTVILFPKNTFHSYYVPKGARWEFYWIHMVGPGCEAMLDYMIREYGTVFGIGCMRQIADCIEQLIHTEYQYYQYELFMTRIINKILYTLLMDLSSSMQTIYRRKSLVDKVIDYVEEHYSEDITLKDLSGQMYMSPEHLIRIFRREMGMTPHQYIKRCRMKKAVLLLEETDLSVNEIARKIGYQSLSSFIASFKQIYHTTPFVYRKML